MGSVRLEVGRDVTAGQASKQGLNNVLALMLPGNVRAISATASMSFLLL